MTNDKEHILIIPPDELSPDTLLAVIEEFVTREGADYGAVEVSLEAKIARVRKDLASGKAILLFDRQDQACRIMSREDPRIKWIISGCNFD